MLYRHNAGTDGQHRKTEKRYTVGKRERERDRITYETQKADKQIEQTKISKNRIERQTDRQIIRNRKDQRYNRETERQMDRRTEIIRNRKYER